jgi:hypothetical protein
LSELHTSPHQSVSGGTRRGPRRSRQRVRAHYVWERLGLGRRRERRLRVGRGERRNAEADSVGFSCGNGNGSTKRDNGSRRGGTERGISARGSVGRRIDDRRRRVGRHLLVAVRRRCSLDLVTQQRQTHRQHLAAQQQRSDESDECEFHARSQYTTPPPASSCPVMLTGRASARAVRAENAAIPGLGPEDRTAPRALVEVHAGVGWHRFGLLVPALRAG